MQLNYNSANTICSGFISELDGGAIIFHDNGDSEVINCSMNTPAFNNPVSGVAQMNTASGDVKDASTVAGTIDHAHFLKANSTIYSQMTCAASGADFNFSTLTFEGGEILIVDSLSVSWEASNLS